MKHLEFIYTEKIPGCFRALRFGSIFVKTKTGSVQVGVVYVSASCLGGSVLLSFSN